MLKLRRMSSAFQHEVNVLRSWFLRRTMRRKFSDWDTVTRVSIQENGHCAACGYTRALQLHLIRPYNLAGDAALAPDNLLVLCMGPHECHLKIGHGGRFSTFNPRAREDAAEALQHPSHREDIERRAGAWRTLVVGMRRLRVRFREPARR